MRDTRIHAKRGAAAHDRRTRWHTGRPRYWQASDDNLDFKRTESGARYFTLADVERMAHALAEGQRIDGATFALSLRMVVTCAPEISMLSACDTSCGVSPSARARSWSTASLR